MTSKRIATVGRWAQIAADGNDPQAAQAAARATAGLSPLQPPGCPQGSLAMFHDAAVVEVGGS